MRRFGCSSNGIFAFCVNTTYQPALERSPRVYLVRDCNVFLEWIFVAKHVKVVVSRSRDEEAHEVTHQSMLTDKAETMFDAIFVPVGSPLDASIVSVGV